MGWIVGDIIIVGLSEVYLVGVRAPREISDILTDLCCVHI